jgi:ferritin
MISQKLQDAINNQINAEMYSAYLYKSMEAYFKGIDLDGFANWMNIQFQEEQAHAFGFFNFLNERGGKIVLGAIEAPRVDWMNATEVFAETLKHEEYVTSLINNLVSLAHEEKDYASANFFQWYIKEQVEEEANATKLLHQLQLVNGEGPALLMLDRELQTRIFNQPIIG